MKLFHRWEQLLLCPVFAYIKLPLNVIRNTPVPMHAFSDTKSHLLQSHLQNFIKHLLKYFRVKNKEIYPYS
jgi:hypothetical protein